MAHNDNVIALSRDPLMAQSFVQIIKSDNMGPQAKVYATLNGGNAQVIRFRLETLRNYFPGQLATIAAKHSVTNFFPTII